jgi:hypothetical protein
MICPGAGKEGFELPIRTTVGRVERQAGKALTETQLKMNPPWEARQRRQEHHVVRQLRMGRDGQRAAGPFGRPLQRSLGLRQLVEFGHPRTAAVHLGTARDGAIDCVATKVHGGRTTQVWDAVGTRRESGKTLALFRCMQMLLYAKA